MNESVLLLTVVSAIAVGTPILLAGLGEILTEQSGVMNLGIEGMMLVGGVAGFWASTEVSSLPLAFAVGMIAGALMGLIHAFFAVTLRVNQIVSGLALVIAGTGISSFIGSLNDGSLFGSRSITSLDPVLSGAITDLPVVGPLIFGHDWVVYLSWVLVGAASFWLFRTKNGLALRAVGEDPPTADAAGISVATTRYIYTLVGGAGAGFGGAYLTIGVFGIWQNGITAGIGWIAVALVIFAGWRPWRALVAAYIFGVLRNLSFTLQIMGVDVPSDVLNALPFVLTIVALIIISARPVSARKFSGPSALAVPYSRESR
jgi:simple sugar transport system permease protein